MLLLPAGSSSLLSMPRLLNYQRTTYFPSPPAPAVLVEQRSRHIVPLRLQSIDIHDLCRYKSISARPDLSNQLGSRKRGSPGEQYTRARMIRLMTTFSRMTGKTCCHSCSRRNTKLANQTRDVRLRGLKELRGWTEGAAEVFRTWGQQGSLYKKTGVHEDRKCGIINQQI